MTIIRVKIPLFFMYFIFLFAHEIKNDYIYYRPTFLIIETIGLIIKYNRASENTGSKRHGAERGFFMADKKLVEAITSMEVDFAHE